MTESAEKPEFRSFLNKVYGVSWPPMVTEQALDALRDYDIRDDDVMVATFPKAGTHWVVEILSLINVNGKVEDIDRNQFCGPLEFASGPPSKIAATGLGSEPTYIRAQTWKSPRVLVTHVLEEFLPKQLKEGKGKVICVIRNPKDTAVSYWNFLKDKQGSPMGEWDSYINMFLEGKAWYGPWYTHVKQYWERRKDSKNFLFLYYEDLKKDHRGGVVQIANFLGRPLSEEAINNIVEHSSIKGMRQTHHTAEEESKQDDSSKSAESLQKKIGAPGIIRKGIVGDWKNRFTVKQNEMFDSVYKKELEGSGIKVEYE